MSEKMPIEKKKVTTPVFRVSFPSIFEAKSFQGQPATFQITMLFGEGKKKAEIEKELEPMKRAVHNAIIEKWGEDKKKWPKNMRTPFRDGDEKAGLLGYAGTIFVSAKSKQQPGLVDSQLNQIIDPKEFYAGCYAKASLIAFAYDNIGVGVSFSLQNVQKVRDGVEFSGRKSASDEFTVIDDGSESESSYKSEDEESSALGF